MLLNQQIYEKLRGTPRVWIVFTGKTEIPWLYILRRGFRHCWILTHDGMHWFSIDPMAHRMEVVGHYHVDAGFDLPAWLAEDGQNTVVQAPMVRVKRVPAPVGVMTCVEVIKRFLGIHAFWVWTPWDLYRHLKRMGGTEIVNTTTKGEKP